MIVNSRIAFYSSLFRDEEIPTLLFFHMIASAWSRFDLHVFVFLCSLSRPAEMLRYWRCYMLDEEKGRGAVRRHGEESLGWLGDDGGLKEGETELVCKMACSTVVASKVMTGLREASVREEAEETLGELQGLLEVSRMSEDASESMEESICGVCLKWLRKERVEDR